MSFRTGDVVLHKRLEEQWLVAWADENDVICAGWPETIAQAGDCELITAATDVQHWKFVEEVAQSNSGSSRSRHCFALLEARRSAECAAIMHL